MSEPKDVMCLGCGVMASDLYDEIPEGAAISDWYCCYECYEQDTEKEGKNERA